MRFSQIVPSLEEQTAKARADGEPESKIRTTINVREQRERDAQAAYDVMRGSQTK